MNMETQTEYRPVPLAWNQHELQYYLVARQGDVAIVASTKDSYRRWLYEVVLIRRLKARSAFGKQFPARESYPSDSQFGLYAWSTGQSKMDGDKPSEGNGWERSWQLFKEKANPSLPLFCQPQLERFQRKLNRRPMVAQELVLAASLTSEARSVILED